MYKELDIWKESVNLIKDVYQIAEGKSRKTGKDFANFLSIASGSLTEVDAILSICQELGYFVYGNNLSNSVITLNKKINSMRSYIINKGSNND